MAAFSRHVETASRKPLRAVKLPPSGFADTWENKPKASVEIGLRLLSEADLAGARAVGVQQANALHPELDERSDIWVEAFNQTLMHYAIALGTCQPDHVEQPFWEMAEDVVPLALSEGGMLRLWSELELLTLIESSVTPEIDEDGLARLVELLQAGGAWEGKSVTQKRRLGRLLTYALELAEPAVELAVERTGG